MNRILSNHIEQRPNKNAPKRNKELKIDISPNELTITDKYGYSITAEQYLRPSTGEQRIRLDVANYTGDGVEDVDESLLDIPSSDFDRLIEYLRELVRER